MFLVAERRDFMPKRIKFADYPQDVTAQVIHVEPWLHGRCAFKYEVSNMEAAVRRWDELVEANHKWGLLDGIPDVDTGFVSLWDANDEYRYGQSRSHGMVAIVRVNRNDTRFVEQASALRNERWRLTWLYRKELDDTRRSVDDVWEQAMRENVFPYMTKECVTKLKDTFLRYRELREI